MIFQRKSRCVWNLVLLLISLALISTCLSKGPIESNAQSIKTDPREELVRSLKGANVKGFDFATNENDAQARAILMNSAAKDLIRLGNSDTNLVLQYTSVKNKKTNTTKIFKTEIVKRGKSLSLVITDLGNQMISKQMSLVEDDDEKIPPFNGTKEDCFKNFNCGSRRAAIQCEVNRTCESVSVHFACCEPLGDCTNYVVLISPTPPYCEFLPLLPLPVIIVAP